MMTSKCIVDLGPGDGRKTVIPVVGVLRSGQYDRVTAVLVDYSPDMLNMSEDYVSRTTGRYTRRFLGENPTELGIVPIHGKFEDLPKNQEYQKTISKHDERQFLFYGTTAGNFDPPQVVEILDGMPVTSWYAGISDFLSLSANG